MLGVTPDLITYSTVIKGYCIQGDLEQAIQLFTLSILVKMYGKNHDIETAFSYFETLPQRYGFEPNAQGLTAMVAACAGCGRVAQALELFGQIPSPDGKAYTTIITGSLKHGDVAGAVRLLAAALAAGAQLADDLVDNVCFMARRRNLAHLLTPLAPRLAAGGYAARDRSGSPTGEAVSPSETAGSRFHARRKQSQSWRDVVVQG